jgi:hypothetical protein
MSSMILTLAATGHHPPRMVVVACARSRYTP